MKPTPDQRTEGPIRLLLIDDHPVFTEALMGALAERPELDIVGTAATGERGCVLAAELSPDVAIVDFSLPDIDGIEVARRLRRKAPDVHVLMLTGNRESHLLPKAMQAGVAGFLLKESSIEQLLDAVHKVNQGQVVIPEWVMAQLVAAPSPLSSPSPLSEREGQVLALLAQGADLHGIAKTLGISWHTARSHVKKVLAKLDARSQLEAVTTAMRLGILSAAKLESDDRPTP